MIYGVLLAVQKDVVNSLKSGSGFCHQFISSEKSMHYFFFVKLAIMAGNNGGTLQMQNSAPTEGHHHMQPPPIVPLADQPLEFTPRFTHENPQPQSSYSYLDSAGPAREMDHSWTAPTHYPPIPPVMPPGPHVFSGLN